MRSAIAAAVAAVALVLIAGPLSASAHGGDIVLRLEQDGIGGIQLYASYAEDAHPVAESINPVLTAVSAETGDTVGPLELMSSSEGEGIWLTEGPVLTEGHWSIEVVVTEPIQAQLIEEMDIVVVDGAEGVEPGSAWILLLVGVGIAAAIAVVLVTLFLVRRRAPRA